MIDKKLVLSQTRSIDRCIDREGGGGREGGRERKGGRREDKESLNIEIAS